MPVVATRFALPREYEAAGVRRYGFHGLSYEYIAGRLRDVAPALAEGRVIAAHLGNGASLCAMLAGRSIDTTMGFTALDGLVMGTRCGNIDPGVILYLEEEQGMAAKEVEKLLYLKSGLLGVSGGIASDMRTLLASRDPRAAEAIELFVYRIAREIGGADRLARRPRRSRVHRRDRRARAGNSRGRLRAPRLARRRDRPGRKRP